MNFKMRVFFFKTEGVAEELMEQLSREYRVKAVSYTHLDVYKRQTEGRICKAISI